MSFRLSNSPSEFMWQMTYVLQPYMSKFVVIYFDDILVYTKGVKEHITSEAGTQQNQLYTNLQKCIFLPYKFGAASSSYKRGSWLVEMASGWMWRKSGPSGTGPHRLRQWRYKTLWGLPLDVSLEM